MSFLLIFLLIFTSCQNGNNPETSESNPSIIISFAVRENKIQLGDDLHLSWKMLDSAQKIDSFVLYVDQKPNQHFSKNIDSSVFSTKDFSIGYKVFTIKVYTPDGIGQGSYSVMITSDIEPQNYIVNVLKSYPHSRETYTQGLIYRDGYFFESGGEYGHSSLKKVKLETGNVEAMVNVESNIFAEGIAIKNDEIFQISWQENVCFVYDISSFQLKRRFKYSNFNEAWGLEFDGTNFLMTDGSNIIYFLNPDSFTIVKKVEVMDQNGPVDSLNELELVDGKLYANLYLTDNIAIIDPQSGKLLGIINAEGLLPKSERTAHTDVLNGIAYNPSNNNFYITGKNWPKLYEVRFKPLK